MCDVCGMSQDKLCHNNVGGKNNFNCTHISTTTSSYRSRYATTGTLCGMKQHRSATAFSMLCGDIKTHAAQCVSHSLMFSRVCLLNFYVYMIDASKYKRVRVRVILCVISVYRTPSHAFAFLLLAKKFSRFLCSGLILSHLRRRVDCTRPRCGCTQT